MRRAALLGSLGVLLLAWITVAVDASLTIHMAAHMAAVAIAAPLLAFALAGTWADPARAWPLVVAPLPMSIVEMVVVWGWHLPAARAFAATPAGLTLEQAMFLGSGLLLWSACLGSRGTASAVLRLSGVVALLLTTMHMTLLGALVALAPRPLFMAHGHSSGAAAMLDQQMAGVVMLAVGAGSYLAGALLLLSRTLFDSPADSRGQGAQ